MSLPPRAPQFPTHPHPRVWLITSSTTAIGTSVARHALGHGDSVIAGTRNVELLKRHDGDDEGLEDFREFWAEVMGRRDWRERCRVVGLDGRCEDHSAYEV